MDCVISAFFRPVGGFCDCVPLCGCSVETDIFEVCALRERAGLEFGKPDVQRNFGEVAAIKERIRFYGVYVSGDID